MASLLQLALNSGMDYRHAVLYKDIAFGALFDPKDTFSYKKFHKKIQREDVHPNAWFNKLRRVYNDQTVYDDTTKRYFEPTHVTISTNKLVDEGLTAQAQSIVGRRTKMFGVYAIGGSAVSVNPKDDRLIDEVSRLDIISNGGFVINRGTTCYYSLFFPKTLGTKTIKETGIFDSLNKNTDIMLLRTVFPSNETLPHNKNSDDISVGHIILIGSV